MRLLKEREPRSKRSANGKLGLFGGRPVRQLPYPQHTTILDDAEEKAVLRVLRSGHLSGFSARAGERFLGGPKVRELERNFAKRFNAKHAITFNSATSALHGAISAAKIGPGDEVITSPTTMIATASSILMQNAIPVFADIEDDTYGLDPSAVRKNITKWTKAILTVNLFGHASRLYDLERIAKRYSLILIEDSAQAPGAVYCGRLAGTIGKMGVLSLNYHKAIQTGEGGVVLTNDDNLARHLRLVRNHGEVVIGHGDRISKDDLVNMLGWNYRLTDLQAAIGIPQLKKLDGLNKIRADLAGRLTSKLKTFDFLSAPLVKKGCAHVYYLYPMRFHKERIGINRSTFVKAMNGEGIALNEGYMKPIYLEPIYQHLIAYGERGCPFKCPWYKGHVNYKKGLCPTAERLYFEELVTTDICKYPNSEKEVDEFVQAIHKILDNIAELKIYNG